MADFYDEMQATATELLTEFNQGVIQYIPLTPPANEWENPTEGTPVPLDAVADGPSQEYLSDLITTSDIQITASVFGQTPSQSGKITIDGVEKQIIKVQQKPAAGTPVCWMIWVKG